MSIEPLLAKSPRAGRPRVTLEAHSFDTERAASRLFGPGSRWGASFVRFFALSDPAGWLVHLRIAALLHDLGKANEDFVAACSGALHGSVQTLRHEHVSALVLSVPEVRAWLEQNERLDVDVIIAAVLSHHFKAARSGPWQWCQPRGKARLALVLGHPEVRAILDRVAAVAGLSNAPALPAGPWCNQPPWSEAYARGLHEATALGRSIRNDSARRALLLATKAGVIAADAASSGLIREGHPLEEWLGEIARLPDLSEEDITGAVLDGRMRDIAGRTRKAFQWHSFQTGVADRGHRVLLVAACAAGKTLAAWKWAARQAAERPIGRVVFLYPTRGTATEGFRDYVAWAPETESALLHGTSRYELEAIQRNPSEAARGKSVTLDESEARLYSLAFWSRRYFSATVDQFLGFMEHHYGSTCLLPVLTDAAVIVDEVHSFDRHMFDVLVSFLRTFDVPILCMTATLPPCRRAQLVAAGLRVYPDDSAKAELADLDERERHPRYRLGRVASVDEAINRAATAYRAGQRVLWVVNTVTRAQAVTAALERTLETSVLCYHSRYRLSDRQRWHAATVGAFRAGRVLRPAIAVTTQVCEMSLDLDADVLLTELAPIPALVQRFGRANRHLARGHAFRADLLVYRPESVAPYMKDELAAADAFLAGLGAAEVSQHDLAAALERHALGEPAADGSARFLESGYFAVPGDLRDADDFAAACVLDGDLPEVSRMLETRQPIDGYLLSIPKKLLLEGCARPARLPAHVGVASSSHYEERRGFVAPEGGVA